MQTDNIILQKDDYTIICETKHDSLRKYAEEWEQLAVNSPQQVPFLTYTWMDSFLKYRITNEKLYCLIVLKQNKLLGLAPLILPPQKKSNLKWLTLVMPYEFGGTSMVDFLYKPGFENLVFTNIIKSIDIIIPNWSKIFFARIPEISPTLEVLSVNNGKTIRSIIKHQGNGAYVDFKENFPSFLSAAKNTFVKKEYNYKSRKVARDHNVKFRFITPDPKESLELLDKFIELELLDNKKKSGAIGNWDPQIRFYKQIIGSFSKNHNTFWGIMEIDGEIASLSLSYILGNTVVRHKTSYNKKYKKYSPGMLLLGKMLEYLHNNTDVNKMNFLTDLPMHQGWNPKKICYYDITIYSKKLSTYFLYYLPDKLLPEKEWDLVKKYIKSKLNRVS